MARLVVRGAASLLFRDHDVALHTQQHLLEGVGEIAVLDRVVAAPGAEQCGLVHEVANVSTRHARSGRSDRRQVDRRR